MTPQNGYVWFLPEWLADGWWLVDQFKEHDVSTDRMLIVQCSTADLKEFVSGGYFSLSNAFYGTERAKILSGGTVGQWRQEYEERVKKEVIYCTVCLDSCMCSQFFIVQTSLLFGLLTTEWMGRGEDRLYPFLIKVPRVQ